MTSTRLTLDDAAQVRSWDEATHRRVAAWLQPDGGGSSYATPMPVELALALDPGGVVREGDRRSSEGGFQIPRLRRAAEGVAEIERGHALATNSAFVPTVALYVAPGVPAQTVAAIVETMNDAGFSQAELVLLDARGEPGAVVLPDRDERPLQPETHCHPMTATLAREHVRVRGGPWLDDAVGPEASAEFAAQLTVRAGGTGVDTAALVTAFDRLRREGHALCRRLRIELGPGLPWTAWLDVARAPTGFAAVDVAP